MSTVTTLKPRMSRLATLLIEAVAGVSGALAVGTLAVALWPHTLSPLEPTPDSPSPGLAIQVATPFVPETEILVVPTQVPFIPLQPPDKSAPKIK